MSDTGLGTSHEPVDIQLQSARTLLSYLAAGQAGHDARGIYFPADHRNGDTQVVPVGGVDFAPAKRRTTPMRLTPETVHGILLASSKLDALEGARIAIGNACGALKREGIVDIPTLAYLDGLTHGLHDQEHAAKLELGRAVRRHPLHPWIKRTVGIGEKQAARFLASLGNCNPAYNETHGRPRRGPAELHAYCGLHTVGGKRPRREGGVQSNWSTTAKVRARLMAESCVQQAGGVDKNGKPRPLSPYRAIYDREREKWADRDTTDLHKHNHALGVVAKEILKDMWRESRLVMEGTTTP